MKLDYVTYFRINESFKNNIFNKVIAYADNKYDNNEELMFLRNAVESYLASIGLHNLDFSKVSHTADEYNNYDVIGLIYNVHDGSTVYTVHILKGLYIGCINATVNAQEEALGSIRPVCITHKKYMINHDLDCNIANIEIEDNVANTKVGEG